MVVKPPSKNNNCDQSIFSNILTIKQSNVMNNIPIFKVGHPRDEIEIEIDDSKLDQASTNSIMIPNSGMSFGCKKCVFKFQPQIFNSQLKRVEIPANAG